MTGFSKSSTIGNADAIDQPLNLGLFTLEVECGKRQAEIASRHINIYLITKYVQRSTALLPVSLCYRFITNYIYCSCN